MIVVETTNYTIIKKLWKQKWTYRPPLRAIVNISATLEIISNATTDALGRIQTEIEQVSQIALENHLALDGLLAAQGVYVNERKQIQTDINQIWQASHLFHQISQDSQSWEKTRKP
uniref:Uncharacterized protein n=1 Tax=Anser cygnoides TaxID=8845 RepID=A0A8B9EGL6_ANSCY